MSDGFLFLGSASAGDERGIVGLSGSPGVDDTRFLTPQQLADFIDSFETVAQASESGALADYDPEPF